MKSKSTLSARNASKLPDLSDPAWEELFLKTDPNYLPKANDEQNDLLMKDAFTRIIPEELAHKTSVCEEKKRDPDKRIMPPKRSIQEEWPSLDLHGLTRQQAMLEANRFMAEQMHFHEKWIRLIVGKGHHSDQGQAVLRDFMEQFVISCKKNCQILEWFWDQKEKQKSGVILVRLIAP